MNDSKTDPHPPEGTPKLIVAIAAVILLAMVVMLAVPGPEGIGAWLWLAVLLVALLAWTILAAPASRRRRPAPPPPRQLAAEEQPAVIREIMEVRLAEEDGGVRLFRGSLRESADAAMTHLKAALGPGTVPLVQPDERCGASILLLPEPEAARRRERSHAWLNWLLFAATLVTTTWAGAAQQGINLLAEPQRFTAGLPYAIGLLAILGVHELGHYWMARHHGMNVTPPYFVPVPFALGTFGAFIRMRTPAENRDTLFDVAVAGPLAGLVIAIPAVIVGLRTSAVLPGGGDSLIGGALPGVSILFDLLARVASGHGLQPGDVVRLSPLAFAGWLGLFVTALNLLPIGQLDGGHIARAMFGSRAGGVISGVALWTLVMLGLFVWPGLLTWAVIVFFIAGRGAPPLNDITPIGGGRRAIGWLAFVILLLIVVPSRVLDVAAGAFPSG